MKYSHYILVLAIIPVLVSCGALITHKTVSAVLLANSQGFFSRPDVNLKEKNYAAADYLVGKMQHFVNHDNVIIAEPLEEVDHIGITSPLGLYIPESIGLRFIDLGYNVWLHKVAANGNAGLYPPPPSGARADFVLKGTYSSNRNDVDIFLRLIDVKSAQVVASFDYSLLRSREVRDLSQTQARIFRVK